MAAIARKVLNLSLEYGDQLEMIMALDKMKSDILKNGLKYQRVMYATSIIEWSITKTDEMEYTEEIINGKMCQVYQSSMNKKKKIKR